MIGKFHRRRLVDGESTSSIARDLDSFHFRESAVNETQLRQLYTGEYRTGARNIVFVGGTGTDRTRYL